MNLFKILYSLLITFSLFSQFRALETNKKSQANQIILQKHIQTIKDLQENKTKICDGNRLKFYSPYYPPTQRDLNITLNITQKQLDTNNVTVQYRDKPGRKYTIFGFNVSMIYQEDKQISNATSVNVLNISGANIKLSYAFKWKKQQLGQVLDGNGTGTVSSDPLSFEKVLVKNENDTSSLVWKLKTANPISISNLFSLKTIDPYKEADAQIIDKMLNQAKDKTIKLKLIQALNKNFIENLADAVKNYTVLSVGKNFSYTYNDYRGSFSLTFSNVLVENYLTTNGGSKGLTLILSQSVMDDETFECGAKVPVDPESLSKYGGNQEYISNIFLRSSLKKALNSNFLDATLNQDSWQSRAFQFYVGDLHEVIDSTKNVSSYVQLKASCRATEDRVFKFQMRTIESYAVNVNFTCQLNLNQTIKVVDIILPVEYEIQPSITNKALNFIVKSLKGTPTFVQNQKFKIGNRQLASFMLIQTLKMAVNSKVIGSGFKVQDRTNPKFQVRKDYLFLYDKPTNSEQSQL